MNVQNSNSALFTSFPASELSELTTPTMNRPVVRDHDNGVERKKKSSRYESSNLTSFGSVSSSD